MKNDKPMCRHCVWRDISGPNNDPALGCGHPNPRIQKQFSGCSSAETCKEYLEDDPDIRVSVARESRESLMKGIHQMAVDSGHYAKAEAILDYFLPDSHSSPETVTRDDFTFVTKVGFGGSEGIYLDCYAEGRIQEDGAKGVWHLGTYKTLDTSLDAMQTLGELGGTLTYFASKYLWEHSDRFLSDRDLRARAIRERKKKSEGSTDK